MKLLSLNTWAGKIFEPLMDYIANQSQEIDLFCFQEVFNTPNSNKIVDEHYRANLFQELYTILPHHRGYFAAAVDGIGFSRPVNYPLYWGLALFVKDSVDLKKVGSIFVHGQYNIRGKDNKEAPRNLQYAVLEDNKRTYTIANVRGLWNGNGKKDTENRLLQSKKIKEFLDKADGKKIICGDFNLLPDTNSLAIIEDGLVNLIKTYDITSTRSSLYYKKPERFADYTLVSPTIEVKQFEVPEVEVSDHLPMILEFF